MRAIKFRRQILYSILLSLLCFTLMSTVLDTFYYYDLLLISIAFFTCVSTGIFFFSRKATTSKDKNFFLYIIIVNVLIKILSAFIIIIIYIKMREPSDKVFILPFLTTYLIFTIFETYFLSKVAESS